MSMFCPECSSILRPKSKGAKKILHEQRKAYDAAADIQGYKLEAKKSR